MRAMPGLKIGRIVWYRSRTGTYSMPAIVTATIDTLFQPNIDAGHIAGVSGPDCIHLTVFTPGKPGKRVTAEDFVVVSEHPIAENVGGVYQEWDIPFWNPTSLNDATAPDSPQPAGTWTWPVRYL